MNQLNRYFVNRVSCAHKYIKAFGISEIFSLDFVFLFLRSIKREYIIFKIMLYPKLIIIITKYTSATIELKKNTSEYSK